MWAGAYVVRFIFFVKECGPNLACRKCVWNVIRDFFFSRQKFPCLRSVPRSIFPCSFCGLCSFLFDRLMKLKFHLFNNSYLKLKLDFALNTPRPHWPWVFLSFECFIRQLQLSVRFYLKLTFILCFKSRHTEILISTFVCLFICGVQNFER